jgi:hypothetical protein
MVPRFVSILLDTRYIHNTSQTLSSPRHVSARTGSTVVLLRLFLEFCPVEDLHIFGYPDFRFAQTNG